MVELLYDGRYVNVEELQLVSHEQQEVVDGDVEEARHGLEAERGLFVVMDEHEVVEQTLDVLTDEVMVIVMVENVDGLVMVVVVDELLVSPYHEEVHE